MRVRGHGHCPSSRSECSSMRDDRRPGPCVRSSGKEALVAVEDAGAEALDRLGREDEDEGQRSEQHQGGEPESAQRVQRSISSPS